MRFIFRVFAAAVVLVFYLPVISGVMLAIADATGGVPGTLTGWWKYIGDVIAEGACGTFRTLRFRSAMSADRGRPEVSGALSNRRD